MARHGSAGAAAGPLQGARIGILEARVPDQLADLVRRRGGVPHIAPALREVALDAAEEVDGLIDALGRGEVQVVIFLTGVGAAALFSEADRIGRLDELVEHLRTTTNLCRGQKPWRPLKERGVPISETVPSPYTTTEVLRALERLELAGKGLALLHYGERNEILARAVTAAGARLYELSLYAWHLPEDTGPLKALVEEIIAGEIEAVLFTTQVQVRHLLQVATRQGRAEALIDALNDRVVSVAVGPTVAAALEQASIAVPVRPENPKMGPMVAALGDYFREIGSAAGGASG